MADRVLPGPVDGTACIREAVCIHTKKIFESCRDKDCIEDLRVYPTVGSQVYIDAAFSVRPKSAELLYVEVSVEPITFNKGYYTVDVTYFYKINGETFPGANPITGLAIFDKRVMLYGSGAGVKTFTSDPCAYGCEADGLPTRQQRPQRHHDHYYDQYHKFGLVRTPPCPPRIARGGFFCSGT